MEPKTYSKLRLISSNNNHNSHNKYNNSNNSNNKALYLWINKILNFNPYFLLQTLCNRKLVYSHNLKTNKFHNNKQLLCSISNLINNKVIFYSLNKTQNNNNLYLLLKINNNNRFLFSIPLNNSLISNRIKEKDSFQIYNKINRILLQYSHNKMILYSHKKIVLYSHNKINRILHYSHNKINKIQIWILVLIQLISRNNKVCLEIPSEETDKIVKINYIN